jgi:hypothetical protein
MQQIEGCSCIRGHYDFKLEAIDQDRLTYQDLSDWMEEYSLPLFYNIAISTTDNPNQQAVRVDLPGVSVINPSKLGLATSYAGIDGFYCFEAFSCGQTYKRTKAVTYQLDCKLDYMIAEGLENQGALKLADRIERYIKAVHYNAERNFLKEADFYYKLAERELSCINCKC